MRSVYPLMLLSLLSASLVQQLLWPALYYLFPQLNNPLVGAYYQTAFPVLTLQSWWSGDFQNTYNRWHRENFGFRNLLVRIHNQKDYSLYGKVHADDVIVGKDGYLFQLGYLTAWTGQYTLSEERVREMAEKLINIQNALQKRGKTFIVAMAPGKASFFPEFVPPHFAAVRQPPNTGEVMSPIFQEMGINLIDYNSDFIARKKTSPYPLFGQTGIHWSNYGAILALQQLIARIEKERGIDMPDIKLLSATLSDTLYAPDGDIGYLLNLIVPPRHYPMAVCHWEWEPSEGHETPKITAFGDSFFTLFVHHAIWPHCFSEVNFYYYSALVWHSANSPATNIKWEPASIPDAMKSVDNSDVILILATEQNYHGLGFGYLDALLEHVTAESAAP